MYMYAFTGMPWSSNWINKVDVCGFYWMVIVVTACKHTLLWLFGRHLSTIPHND